MQRGLKPSVTDEAGASALQYSVRMERIEYLSYMLEGDFNAYLSEEFSMPMLNISSMSKRTCMSGGGASLLLGVHNIAFQRNKKAAIIDALLSLDTSSLIHGHTPFHDAAKVGNTEIFLYLLRIFKRREEILKQAYIKKERR